ncbi:alpha/beta-hydrolase [Epithele typhae]|uniref:alpha/beta-hydrolase n=1 Tax=Epithele typhae TaxID=378194 RepID=UPI002007F662|nr:alpha/beta-hydrolase [Epithele typhae]KAH9919460.1 alpha/beta-hydrolase [Epithele typhae]
MFSRLTTFLSVAMLLPSPWSKTATRPDVKLDKATIIGTTTGNVTSFLGIPFARLRTVGDLRLRLPVPVEHYSGTINATQTAAQCIQLVPFPRQDEPAEMQQLMNAYATAFSVPLPESEDCLTVDVQVPAGTKPGQKLPVVVMIFGGGFTIGSSAANPGNAFIARSVELGEPIIYVAMNHRLHALGFLAGQEVKDAGVGNLGLHDQREALRWVQKHISAFGGDPCRVTLWGASSGAISIGLQIVTNGGDSEGLFHGAVMNAGSPIPLAMSHRRERRLRWAADTLDCLRQLPLDVLMNATAPLPNLFGYQGLATPWAPHADGQLVLREVWRTSLLTGDALDEGTIFATGSFNVTKLPELRLRALFPASSCGQARSGLRAVPERPRTGLALCTGDANQLAPMYKRMAAFQGDIIFQAPRRFFLEQRADKQPMYSFISSRGSGTPLGVAHGSDFVPALSQGDELADYIIKFAATGNPNGASNRTIEWPRYDKVERKVLSLLPNSTLEIGNDTLRLEPMTTLMNLTVQFPS